MREFERKRKTWISSAHQGFVTEGMVSNTLRAYRLAADKGADMIETDARMTKDGVLIVNHDPDVKGFDADGNPVCLLVAETEYAALKEVRLSREDRFGDRIATLEQALHLAYHTGMCINIDLKNGAAYAEKIAETVVRYGMRGRTVYATNGAGADCIRSILAIDPDARFIDTKQNYTQEKLSGIEGYASKCYVYTGDFSDENIAEIRASGCMLATISLNADNAVAAFRHHPDMAEYPHTSDFEAIDQKIMEVYRDTLLG